MNKNLVIVESPAKAKTIEKFLGRDYVVKSSFGHIRDLPKKGLSIDIDKGFEPKYEISPDKQKVVRELKVAAKNHEVWLASDEDREGEAIAWHLTQALKLDPKSTKRIVFHEITKTAIDKAIKNPRHIDINLVEAQQARRVLDRLVGYELSPVLWKKVRGGLSAGRVQSVAVRLIVDREREIKNFRLSSSYKITADFSAKGGSLTAELDEKLKDRETTKTWLEKLINATFTVEDLKTSPGFRNPSAPFTTSTLQQEASRRLGYSVRQTMTLAQRLYEAGHITYMRTDSTVLSKLATDQIKQLILKEYGQSYHKYRQFKTKSISAQEAHEAIRPTDSFKTMAGADDAQKKLYDLIRKRAVASQMSPAAIEKTEIDIKISNQPQKFIAKGEVLKFDGFMKVYGGSKDDVILPKLNLNDILQADQIRATEVFARAPSRFSEASLVRKLEELGIGRPSTYAPTISTIQTRGYVEVRDVEGIEREFSELSLAGSTIKEAKKTIIYGADKSKLMPTSIAEVVTDFLVKFFPAIVDYDFTAKVEREFDEIAQGQEAWDKMIADFYKTFHPLIENSEDISRQEVSQAKELGIDPKTGEKIYARYGRYGPMLVKGDTEDSTKKPQFAPMPADTSIETVTLDKALEMFKLPRIVGKTEDNQEIKANIGRFGPYIQIGKIYVSIKPLDPHDISEEEARQLYKEKLTKDASKNIQQFKTGIKILNGPYGPYVTDGKKNVRIDKDTDPTTITETQAEELLKKAPLKKARHFRRTAKKKAA
jgi:DNA topoisomerase-1